MSGEYYYNPDTDNYSMLTIPEEETEVMVVVFLVSLLSMFFVIVCF